jgi:hypothetical protein
MKKTNIQINTKVSNAIKQQRYLLMKRKKYGRQTKNFLNSINLGSINELLDSQSTYMLFCFRPLPIKLHNATGINPDPARDSHLNSLFDLTLKEYDIPFDKHSSISLNNILERLQAIYLLFKYKFACNVIDINQSPELNILLKRTPIVYNMLHQYIRKICYLYSIYLMEGQLEYIRFNPIHINTNNPDNTYIPFHLRFRPKPTISYTTIPIPTKKITINNKARTCFRIGFPNKKFELVWASIPAKTLGIRGNHQYPVYCQNHVMLRIKERLSPLGYYDCISAVCSSIADNHPIIRMASGKFFIPVYLHHEYKLGYLTASCFNGMIVLQTFLFITCSSTPEGAKLDQLSGLSKLDKNYLAIDKLSSCLAIKIEDDSEVMELFRTADLVHLTSKELRKLASIPTPKSKHNKPTLLHEYINQYKKHIKESEVWDDDMQNSTDNQQQESVSIQP